MDPSLFKNSILQIPKYLGNHKSGYIGIFQKLSYMNPQVLRETSCFDPIIFGEKTLM